MDRTEYTNKARGLLEDGGIYKEIKTYPTNKLKNKLINLLKKIKAEEGITDHLYKKMYPIKAVASTLYGLPKIHKKRLALRPLVSSRGSINYEVVKELVRILRPLVGNSPHHIKNTGNFVQQIKRITLQAMNILHYTMSLHYLHLCL